MFQGVIKISDFIIIIIIVKFFNIFFVHKMEAISPELYGHDAKYTNHIYGSMIHHRTAKISNY